MLKRPGVFMIILLFSTLIGVSKGHAAEVLGTWDAKVGNGNASNHAHLYTDGTLVHDMHSHSSEKFKAARAGTFVIGVDAAGRNIYISPYHEIPTACGSYDSCPTSRNAQAIDKINAELAALITRLDVYGGDRSTGSIVATWSRFMENIKVACSSLPPAAQVYCQ